MKRRLVDLFHLFRRPRKPDGVFVGRQRTTDNYYFNKLSSALTESTVWTEPYSTRIVWVAMLATADQYGRVFGAIPGLARRANVTLEEAEVALRAFKAPDPYSRTTDFEGRRVEDIDGGWLLLNHGKYRGMRDEVHQRAKAAERQRRHRAKGGDAPSVTEKRDMSREKRDRALLSPQAEAEACNASAKHYRDQLTGLTPDADPPEDLESWFGSRRETADGE